MLFYPSVQQVSSTTSAISNTSHSITRISISTKMRFSVTSAVAIIAGLTVGGSAFVIDTFSGNDCGGSRLQEVNIWDNTCASWPTGFGSFKITTWGGSHQKAYFFAPDGCGSLPGNIKSGYVDSSTNDFAMGRCYGFNGASANAIASYSA
jgi:hypothetical protein